MRDEASHREFGSWLEPYMDLFVSGMRVLEAGCGIGSDARYLAGHGLTVTALDLSPERVAQAASTAPEARFLVADLRAGLPLRDCSAERVVSSLSLHYFDRQTTALIVSEISRVLVPGGILLCRVNVVGDRGSLWGVGTEHEPDYFEVWPGHFKRFFTPETLTETLETAFAIDSICREQTMVHDGTIKETLVAIARRGPA